MPGEEEPDTSTLRPVVVIGLLVGLALGTVGAWALSDDSPSGPPAVVQPDQPRASIPETPEAAEAFLAAWERSRSETFISISEWHRETTQGAEATDLRAFAQRLPDRIRSGADHRSGRIGDHYYTCDRLPLTAEQAPEDDPSQDDPSQDDPSQDDPADGEPGVDEPAEGETLEGEVVCRRSAPVVDDEPVADAEALVAEEVELMRRHVEGTHPLYRVGQVDNCFHLRLDRLMVVPPYGYRTTFCFDPESGAVSSLELKRAEGTDTENLLWVDTEVTDDDLLAIIEGRFDPQSR